MTDIFRKRLLYQATHRGKKEADCILGGFVQRHLDDLSLLECEELETILACSDEGLMMFFLQNGPSPCNNRNRLLQRMRDEIQGFLAFKKNERKAIIGDENEN